MLDASAALLGLGLGLSHATEVDHIAAVSTLIQRQKGSIQAARVAALWGLGHTASFLAVGLCIVFGGLRVPETFELFADVLVAAMLIGLGVVQFARGRTREAAPSAARPVLVGLLHGLAGSAAVALLAATTIRSALWASVYLALFGMGTMIGMSALAVLLSWPIAWASRSTGLVARWFLLAPGAFSIALGILVGAEGFLLPR